MPILNCHFLGRLGNAMFSYAMARGFCERNGLTLHTDPWLGQKIFMLDDPLCDKELPRKDEYSLKDGDADVSFRSYAQQQKCLEYYTRADCKRWFQFLPEIARRAEHYKPEHFLAHHRKGDYFWNGSAYPVVSRRSYTDAFDKLGKAPAELRFVSEEDPVTDPNFEGELSLLPDFIRLTRAKVLFRANSSFSWWAAVLSNADVYSPVCAHLHGGREHDGVEFVNGNWPRLAGFEYTTDLRLRD